MSEYTNNYYIKLHIKYNILYEKVAIYTLNDYSEASILTVRDAQRDEL